MEVPKRRAHNLQIVRGRVILRGPERRKELIGAVLHVRAPWTRGPPSSRSSRQDAVVDDHSAPAARSASTAFVNISRVSGRSGMFASIASFRPLAPARPRGRPWNGTPSPARTNAGTPNRLPLKRAGLEPSLVGRTLRGCGASAVRESSASRRPSRPARWPRRSPCARWGPCCRAASRAARCRDADEAARREHADQRAGRGRHPNRVAGIRAVAQHRHVRRHGGDDASRGATRGEAHVVGGARAAERAAAVRVAGRQSRACWRARR